jgi:hypothetical protein
LQANESIVSRRLSYAIAAKWLYDYLVHDGLLPSKKKPIMIFDTRGEQCSLAQPNGKIWF